MIPIMENDEYFDWEIVYVTKKPYKKQRTILDGRTKEEAIQFLYELEPNNIETVLYVDKV